MDKSQVIEIAFETIEESTEWGMKEDGKTYGHWINGVVTMTANLLDMIKEEKNDRM